MTSLQNGNTPLMKASKYGHVECVKALLDKYAMVNQENKVGASPMFADCDEVTYMSMICVIMLEVGSEGEYVG